MYEVIRWISIVLMWSATGMNVYALIRCNRTWKRCVKKEKELDAERKYCTAMMSACSNYIKARQEELKSIVEEVSDEGEN